MAATAEFWRWKETTWHDTAMSPREAQVLAVGIDVGSVSSQAVILADAELYAYSNLRTVLDMGGQDCKAIHCDETGKGKAFLVNDKCAAVFARVLYLQSQRKG